jgi:hypothetical protein
MRHANPIDIGLVLYPDAQQAAVLGLVDLFGIAAAPVSDAGGVPAALIVPPTLPRRSRPGCGPGMRRAPCWPPCASARSSLPTRA